MPRNHNMAARDARPREKQPSKVSAGKAWVMAFQAAAASAPTTPITSPAATPTLAPVRSPGLGIHSDDDPRPNGHLLSKTWTVWFNCVTANDGDRRGKHSAVKSKISPPKAIGNFGTVEEMWRWLNNIKSPSTFANDANIYMFISGIEPFWEDIANTMGGKWLVTFYDIESADKKWLDLCLAVFGGNLPDIIDEVVGIIASRRRNYVRLAVWTRNKSNDAAVLNIGNYLKQDLELAEFEYQDHGCLDYTQHRHKLK
jgi:hypothetical protein